MCDPPFRIRPTFADRLTQKLSHRRGVWRLLRTLSKSGRCLSSSRQIFCDATATGLESCAEPSRWRRRGFEICPIAQRLAGRLIDIGLGHRLLQERPRLRVLDPTASREGFFFRLNLFLGFPAIGVGLLLGPVRCCGSCREWSRRIEGRRRALRRKLRWRKWFARVKGRWN